MKILHLIASTGVGGAEKHLLDLTLQQQEFGMDVCVALPEEGALSQALQAHNIKYVLIRKGSRFNLLALWSLRQAIHQVQPDIVHAHMLKSATMVSYASRSVPCVATAHNIVKHLKPFRKCHHVICVSDMVFDSLSQLGYPQAKMTVVHNAVDTHVFNTERHEEVRRQLDWQNRLIVLIVARLVPAKGQVYALDALAQLVLRFPNIQLVLVGEGTDRDKLQQQAHKLGLEKHLSMLGSRRDVVDLLAATDIYLQPSIKEGFCIAFLEAMATGIACIGTQTGAIPTMLESGVNGILIPPGDVSAIANAVSTIATNPELRTRYAQAAKLTAQTKFSPQKQALETINVYNKELNH